MKEKPPKLKPEGEDFNLDMKIAEVKKLLSNISEENKIGTRQDPGKGYPEDYR